MAERKGTGESTGAAVRFDRREDVPAALLADPLDIRCQRCASQGFRRSRLRAADLAALAMMRYPVRCLRCSQRQTVSFAIAGLAVPSSVKHTSAEKANESWRQWTEHTTVDPSTIWVDAEKRDPTPGAREIRPEMVERLQDRTVRDGMQRDAVAQEVAAEDAVAKRVAAQKRVDDQAIW